MESTELIAPIIAWSSVGGGHALWVEYKYPERLIMDMEGNTHLIPPATERYVHFDKNKNKLRLLAHNQYPPKPRKLQV